MNFKKGDKVIVNPNVKIGDKIYGFEMYRAMFQNASEVNIVTQVRSPEKKYTVIEISRSPYGYPSEWLTLVEKQDWLKDLIEGRITEKQYEQFKS